jgi:phage tail tube protein FII
MRGAAGESVGRLVCEIRSLLMTWKLFICGPLVVLTLLASSRDTELYAQEGAAETVTLCKLASRLDKYRGAQVTVRVRVKVYRHGTTISDRACPKQSLLLIADQAAVQTASLSRFYKFLAEHRRSGRPIFATITGRLVKGEAGGFVLKRDVAFKLELVSEVSEGV